MRKQEYILTLVYAGLMIVVPFIGFPFGFRRAIVLLCSVAFLGYIWFQQHQKTNALYQQKKQAESPSVIRQTVISETIIEQAAGDFTAEPVDQSEVSEQL